VRKVLLAMAAALVLAACSNSSTEGTTPPSSNAGPTALNCTPSALQLKTPGQLTVATDDPAFQPWFAGTGTYGPWKGVPNEGTGNPASGQGYESATAYGIATQLGFTKDQVKWIPVNFNNSYKPGPKDFDFFIGQVSYSPERAQAVTFSDGYYPVQQALVANKGTPIAQAKTFADLQGYKLGVQIGTTSYSYIVNNIKPTQQPAVFDNSNDVIQALNNKQIDGYLVDAPDAYVNVLIGEAKNGVVVGQLPTIGAQEHFAVVFETGDPLVTCVNKSIGALQSNGTLTGLQTQYLKDITFPEISQ
jgi:polar amino acid transport system substrate-binding protein